MKKTPIRTNAPKETVSTIEQEVLFLLKERGLTLSTAESCTGGLIAKRLTDFPGASDVFLGGVVSYSNEMKFRALGVRRDTVEKHGAVSLECVEEMLRGVCERSGSDAGIAVSGIAGPGGGTVEKPVGTVCLAVMLRGRVVSRSCLFHGGRGEIRECTASESLKLLRMMMLDAEKLG